MNIFRFAAVVVLVVSCGFVVEAAEWKAGVARTDITPEKPVWMAGYAARTRPAEGTIHPLWAKALVIEDHRGERVVIVTSDLIGFVREMADRIGDRVQRQTGIERDRIVMSVSHTHCGPVILGCADIAHHMAEEDVAVAAAYRKKLEDKVVDVISQASKAIQPAKLAFGEGHATFAKNRRGVQTQAYANSPGPVDHTVPVLRVTDQNDRPLAVLFGYACHNTTLGGDFYSYNGDYAGFAQIEVEAKHPGVMAMFITGCGADANPQPRGKLELAEQHGKSLAAAVDGTLSGELHPVNGALAVAFERVDLPFVDPPTKEELEKRRGEGTVYQQRLTELLLKRFADRGQIDNSYPYPVQVVRFGDDLSMVALAGEVVVDYALRLRKRYEGQRIWVAGYSNEVFAYLPSERVLSEGGYEGASAMVYFGWHGPFKPGMEDCVVGLINKLMDRCRQTVRQAAQ